MKNLTILLILVIPVFTFSQIIQVPEGYPTIQQGIDIAKHGDTILVAEGVYFENLNFKGKAITLASYFLIDGNTKHVDNTIIDGSHAIIPDSVYVIYFVNNEDSNSVLLGFTLMNRIYISDETRDTIGGSVYLYNTSPLILNNKTIQQAPAMTFGDKSRRFKSKTFVTWISLMYHSEIVKGSLYQLNNSSLILVPNAKIKQNSKGEMKSSVFKIDQVNTLKIRRKGSIVKGTVIGAVSGLAIGVIIGFISGDNKEKPHPMSWEPYKAQDKAAVYGIACMFPAAAIGAMIGSIQIQIPINRNQGTYERNRKQLERYSVK